MSMRCVAVVVLLLVASAGAARAEQDYFLSRDETVPARTYLESDGGVLAKEPAESPWETWEEGEAPPPDRFELPGLWSIKQTSPELQTFVAGPTFRSQKNRIELGAGFGYINSRWRFPFELSVEPTWRRNWNLSPGADRDFARLRVFGLVEAWDRSSNWESTAVAVTGFYDGQNSTFNDLEFGGSVTQVIGRRLAISGNLAWYGTWPNGGDFHSGAVGSVGVSYNVGAGVRGGGFYEPDNNVFHEDDYGGFLSYQFLPFAEFVVNAGKHDFVMARLMISYALERP
jgi:hypothetical protein